MKLFVSLSVVAIMLVACSKKNTEPTVSKPILERHSDAICWRADTMGFFYNTDNTLERMYLTHWGMITYNYIFRYANDKPYQFWRGYYLTDGADNIYGTFEYKDKGVNFNWSTINRKQYDSLIFNDKQQLIESHTVRPEFQPMIGSIDRFFWDGGNVIKKERYDAWTHDLYTTIYTYDDKKNIYPAGLAYVLIAPEFGYYLSANNIKEEITTRRNGGGYTYPVSHIKYRYLYNDKGLATNVMKSIYDELGQVVGSDSATVVYPR
ncbi:MAG: hypothetical protein J7623_13025 [Chitinophaga sp.]|uniref:hypothetical protein n=1 Tax=Chitinophaga sp. TaxID=1869181 RepID=UPI001B1BCFC7|nr:hypothetical protein [Chitinophaga sp.]MBO9729553.1 hypothetical protein [Chitinophaga sp.]